jgi:hypothetical protein
MIAITVVWIVTVLGACLIGLVVGHHTGREMERLDMVKARLGVYVNNSIGPNTMRLAVGDSIQLTNNHKSDGIFSYTWYFNE